MDDFGTSYSSLAYLQRLPIDVLKVDHSFVKGMLEEEDSFEIVNAIISLARSLMMDTVAEGIERPEQAARLRTMGCVYGQGYLYARPLCAADFPAYLENCKAFRPPTGPGALRRSLCLHGISAEGPKPRAGRAGEEWDR